MTPASAGALAQLLDREREALLHGRWDSLDRLGAEKARLVERLRREAQGAGDLRRLASGMERNQKLLQAAMSGARAAVERLSAIRDAQGTLRTYDAAGQSSDLAPPARGLERKA